MTADELVHLSADAGVATVTLDSPPNRNALSRRLVAELHAALTEACDDQQVRVLVLTGTGPVFCSGADLKEQRAGGGPGLVGLPDVLTLLMDGPKPSVARVNGPARAGGLGLLAACDLTVAPTTATFGFSEVRLGVVPAVISVPCLRRVEPRAAREYFLTGETFDGVRAEQIGLLNRAVPADELDDAIEAYVGMLVRGGPEALALTKELLRTVPELSVEEGLRRMGELSAARFASAEGQEGIAAFQEKRDPVWMPPARRG
jgi:methylglutaconyl-CoA hydratase